MIKVLGFFIKYYKFLLHAANDANLVHYQLKVNVKYDEYYISKPDKILCIPYRNNYHWTICAKVARGKRMKIN